MFVLDLNSLPSLNGFVLAVGVLCTFCAVQPGDRGRPLEGGTGPFASDAFVRFLCSVLVWLSPLGSSV